MQYAGTAFPVRPAGHLGGGGASAATPAAAGAVVVGAAVGALGAATAPVAGGLGGVAEVALPFSSPLLQAESRNKPKMASGRCMGVLRRRRRAREATTRMGPCALFLRAEPPPIAFPVACPRWTPMSPALGLLRLRRGLRIFRENLSAARVGGMTPFSACFARLLAREFMGGSGRMCGLASLARNLAHELAIHRGEPARPTRGLCLRTSERLRGRIRLKIVVCSRRIVVFHDYRALD